MEDKSKYGRPQDDESVQDTQPDNRDTARPNSEGSGARKAEDEIAHKGEPRPFEEGWKEQEKFRAD